MNKKITIGFILMALCGSSFASVTVLENTATRLVFSWKLEQFDTASFIDSGRTVTSLSFADNNIALGSEGEHVIPGVSLFAGMPSSGTARIRFTPLATKTITLAHPLRKTSAISERGRYKKTDSLRFDGPWISVPVYTAMHSMRVVNVVLKPVAYDPSLGTIEVLTGGECSIEFPAAPWTKTVQAARVSDYERMVEDMVLNYSVARGWVSAVMKKRMAKKSADIFPLDYDSLYVKFTIGDGHEGTNEGTINENGLVRITGTQVIKFFGGAAGTIPVSAVRVYGSHKGALGQDCPDTGAIPAGVYEEPLIRVDVNTNGMVDAEDYFLAYVTGGSDWEYDSIPVEKRMGFLFRANPYDNNRSYYLTVKRAGVGLSPAVFAAPPGAIDTLIEFTNRANIRQLNKAPVFLNSGGVPDPVYSPGSVWTVIYPGNPIFEHTLQLPFLDPEAGGSIMFKTINPYTNYTDIFVNGDSLCRSCENNTKYPVSRWGDRRVSIRYTPDNRGDYWQLVSMEATYRSKLVATGDTVKMNIFASDSPGVKTYRFSGLNGRKSYVLRLPGASGPFELIETVVGKNTCVWSDSSVGVRYFIASENAISLAPLPDLPAAKRRPLSSGYQVARPRDITNESDYLIITHPDFIDQAVRLAAHKAQVGFRSPRVVTTAAVYDDFSGGNFDPVAIRNFLAYAKRNWNGSTVSLDYVVLMGNGHLDYKKVFSTETNFIPPMEREVGYPESTCSDDFYALVTPGPFSEQNLLSFALGRFPCMTPAEAGTMVDKVIDLESAEPGKADWGAWRNSMLLVADDDMQRSTRDPINGLIGHHVSSEKVYKQVRSMCPSMDLKKVYLFEYEWSQENKPEASRAIINELNNGVMYANFFGHGSPIQWTDERVMLAANTPQLSNHKRYPLISSFSCSVGLFDFPGSTSLSEALFKVPGGGAGATISATRSSGATSNEQLALNFCRSFFDTALCPSIGVALVKAKFVSKERNSVVYYIMGDPALRFLKPTRSVKLQVLVDSNGTAREYDTLKALQPITIKGTVVDANGNPDVSFGSLSPAYVQLGFYNAPEVATRKDNGWDNSVNYIMPGKPVFTGRVLVRDGRFTQTAILPRSLSFDRAGPQLTAYAWENDKIGTGSRDYIFHGSVPPSEGMKNDTAGPRITIRPLYDNEAMGKGEASFNGTITSSLPLRCELVFTDPSGIDISGTGPDEGLTMEIQGYLGRRNINQKFKFSEGDYRTGAAVLSFDEGALKTGTYALSVSAQDLIGNVAKTSFTLEVVPEASYSLSKVFNTPNPMRMGEKTQFFFFPSTTSTDYDKLALEFGVMIKIYSLSGRLLRMIKNARNGEYWDGRDQSGYPLPPNIYLFQVTAWYPQQEKQIKSKIEKIVIHPPRK